MDSADIAKYAKMVRGVLTMAGPQPRLRIGLLFQKLGLSKEETDEVIADGLANGVLHAEGHMLRESVSTTG